MKDEASSGVAPDVMSLDPRLSDQLFAFLYQLIESIVQIETQMQRDWKQVANFRASFFFRCSKITSLSELTLLQFLE